MSEPSAPVISVVIPVYNAGSYLPNAIQSVLSQSFKDFECIVVDDGSTDGSLATLRKFAVTDSRLRVISRANTGIVGALNDGLAASRGTFIARMDADDWCLPQRFARQLAFMVENPDHVAVGSQVILIDDQGDRICVKKDTQFTNEDIDAAHMSFGWPIVHPATLFRRDAIMQVGGYRLQYQWLEDLDLYLRLAEIGKLANLPEILFLYRQHFASVCYTRADEQSQLRLALYQETLARRRKLGMISESTITGYDARTDATAEKPLRMGGPRNPCDVHTLWAWWALQCGNVLTARKHARRRLRLSPWSRDSWRLMYCCLRGR